MCCSCSKVLLPSLRGSAPASLQSWPRPWSETGCRPINSKANLPKTFCRLFDPSRSSVGNDGTQKRKHHVESCGGVLRHQHIALFQPLEIRWTMDDPGSSLIQPGASRLLGPRSRNIWRPWACSSPPAMTSPNVTCWKCRSFLFGSIWSALAKRETTDDSAQMQRLQEAVRGKVPPEHQAEFESLLEEARLVNRRARCL